MILAIAFISLQFMDWWTTRRVLSLGGVEGNPVMQWVLSKVGIWGLLAVKMIAGFGIAIASIRIDQEWILIPLCAAFGWVVRRNWKMGSDMKKKKSGGTGRPKPPPSNKANSASSGDKRTKGGGTGNGPPSNGGRG